MDEQTRRALECLTEAVEALVNSSWDVHDLGKGPRPVDMRTSYIAIPAENRQDIVTNLLNETKAIIEQEAPMSSEGTGGKQ